MGALTDAIPKPLIPLNDRPVLQHILEYYIARGFRKFVLCVGYQGHMIREYVSRVGLDADFEFSDAGETASMLARLYHARNSLGPRVFVAYGDTLVTIDLEHMLADHLKTLPAITMTVGKIKSPFGLVGYDSDGTARFFEEKPILSYYIGHLLLETELLHHLSPELLSLPDGAGLVTLFRQLIGEKRVRIHTHHGPQITFNTRQERDQAERELVHFFTHSEGESNGTQ